MSILITGHKSGIGKELYNCLPGSVGISRSNGYNIDNVDSISKLIEDLDDVTHVINNAYSPRCGQSNLLLKLYFKFPRVKIISIGSKSMLRVDADTLPRIEYAADKYHLYETHMHLTRLDKSVGNIRSMLLILGMVDTSYNKDKIGEKLHVDQVTSVIMDMMKNPRSICEL